MKKIKIMHISLFALLMIVAVIITNNKNLKQVKVNLKETQLELNFYQAHLKNKDKQ